jgi:hypothetical protein
MNENTQLTFYLKDLHSGEVLREETRTLKGWTGLTDAAMEEWSVMHLERVLEQVRRDWVSGQVVAGWQIVKPDAG